ncbi:signal peptidase I [Clostridium perfringens]
MKKKPGLKDDIFFLVFKISIFLILLGVMFFFVFGIERSSDYTMYPSVKDGDLALYYRLQKDFAAGDVIIVEKNGKEEIRRIIAVPGDTVDITRDGLKINGYLQQENSIYAETLPYLEGIKFPVTVGKDNYFVLADARLNTRDSRMYGTVKKEEIKGVVMTLIRRRGI